MNKKDIEKLLKDINNGFREFKNCNNYVYPLDYVQYRTIKEYIQQLEVEKQKLIENNNKVLKLLIELKKELMEELKYNCTKREARMQLSIVDIILKTMEGEKK